MLLAEAALILPMTIMLALGGAQMTLLFITAQAQQTAVNEIAVQWSAGEIATEGEAEAQLVAKLREAAPWIAESDIHVDDTRRTATAFVVSVHVPGSKAGIIAIVPSPSQIFASAMLPI